jgi:phage-related protein
MTGRPSAATDSYRSPVSVVHRIFDRFVDIVSGVLHDFTDILGLVERIVVTIRHFICAFLDSIGRVVATLVNCVTYRFDDVVNLVSNTIRLRIIRAAAAGECEGNQYQ